jgi:uncharacterized protein DUF1844
MSNEWTDDQKTQPDAQHPVTAEAPHAEGAHAEAPPHDDDAPHAAVAHAAGDAHGIPEIDFGVFVMSLASSVLVHLGEIEHPDAAAAQLNLPLAKQTLDILGMLRDKTRGNLTQEETQLLDNLLYDLRMKYVDAKKR